MKFKGTVSVEFINRRNELVKKDNRDTEKAMRQWDFEYPEYHQCLIPSSGHHMFEGYEYDTQHIFFDNCDFKYVNKSNGIHISKFILQSLKEGIIDHIVAWKYINKDWSRALQEGDSVQYEILEYIPTSEILGRFNIENGVRGFTINCDPKYLQ
jgi:hypothetical protein